LQNYISSSGKTLHWIDRRLPTHVTKQQSFLFDVASAQRKKTDRQLRVGGQLGCLSYKRVLRLTVFVRYLY